MTEEKPDFFTDYQNLINSFEALKKSEKNPFYKSGYTPLNVILPIVKEQCTKHNFVFYQYPELTVETSWLTTVIRHKSGKLIEGHAPLVSKDPNDPQKLGGSLTYMRRYSLVCMFGLEEIDDDGNDASTKPSTKPTKNISFEQQCELAKKNQLMCADCASDIVYYELKNGEARLKCPKDWKHRNYKSKAQQKEDLQNVKKELNF